MTVTSISTTATARRLGVTESAVSRVASGKAKSRRISTALVQELRRIEREIIRNQERAA